MYYLQENRETQENMNRKSRGRNVLAGCSTIINKIEKHKKRTGCESNEGVKLIGGLNYLVVNFRIKG